MKKLIIPLLLIVMFLLNVNSVLVGNRNDEQSVNQAPVIKDGQSEQTGMATPASANNEIDAVPYITDVSQWFEDIDGDRWKQLL